MSKPTGVEKKKGCFGGAKKKAPPTTGNKTNCCSPQSNKGCCASKSNKGSTGGKSSQGCCGTTNCCGSKVKNDKFSSFGDACYTANMEKMKEQLKKNSSNKQKLIDEKTEDGLSPLHLAAQQGNAEVISFLIGQKANVTSLTQAGETPLHIACFHRNKAAVRKLLETDARKHIDHQESQHGMTALHVAIYRGSPEIAELLLQAGGSTNLSDKYGNNALDLAEFWVGQAEAGLSSPTANHHQTLEILKKKMNVAGTADYTPVTVQPAIVV